jgi:hypothetical protein
MSVQEITSLVDQLSSEERDELEAHLQELRAREWDEQIERDAEEGKLDTLLAEVDAEIQAGLSQPL